MASRAVLVIAAGAACSHHAPAMYPAGTARDDGYGDLAQRSARLLTAADDAPALARHHHHRLDGAPYGGDPYAGMYAEDGDADGDVPDFAPHPRTVLWSKLHTRNTPREAPASGLTGAIEGTVRWRGAAPLPVVTACGTIDQPSARVTAGGGVAGVLVYIEHVETGRAIPNYSRPASVGGLIAKRGCALAPALQIVTPLPSGFTIHGDTREVTLRITPPAAGGAAVALEAAGRVVVQAQPGITRVEADDGSLAAAWIVAADTPYYAITDDAGRFRLDELAAGTYDVSFLGPSPPEPRGGKLHYGAPVIVHRSVKIDATHAARVDLTWNR
ncbi:MAG TPA: hypothetical protein VFP84_37105 [Kofleriaceae bacterium]|nr:hypothetical protein [Kofleriaceae bacterium]